MEILYFKQCDKYRQIKRQDKAAKCGYESGGFERKSDVAFAKNDKKRDADRYPRGVGPVSFFKDVSSVFDVNITHGSLCFV